MTKSILYFIFFCFSSNITLCQLNRFLPTPSGKYFIGTKNLFFTDPKRKEKLTLKWGDKRSLQIKIWYPADSKGENENMYLKDYSATILWENYKIFNDSKMFFDSLKNYKTFSFENIPISKNETKFPIIVFSPGYYFGLDDFYTAQMENLASNGYVVISITHPYDQVIANTEDGNILKINKFRMSKAYYQWKKVEFLHKKTPDSSNLKQTNRILKAYLRGMRVFDRSVRLWVQDAQFVLDTLFKKSLEPMKDSFFYKMDFSKIGTLGQSVGGAVSGQLCFVDSRIKAGINLDCFQFGDIYQNRMEKPFMLLQSESYPLWSIANKIIYTNTSPFYSIHIANSRHFIFSDCSIFPVKINERLKSLVGDGDNKANVKIINDYIIEFYNFYLKQIPFSSTKFHLNN